MKLQQIVTVNGAEILAQLTRSGSSYVVVDPLEIHRYTHHTRNEYDQVIDTQTMFNIKAMFLNQYEPPTDARCVTSMHTGHILSMIDPSKSVEDMYWANLNYLKSDIMPVSQSYDDLDSDDMQLLGMKTVGSA